MARTIEIEHGAEPPEYCRAVETRDEDRAPKISASDHGEIVLRIAMDG